MKKNYEKCILLFNESPQSVRDNIKYYIPIKIQRNLSLQHRKV